MDRWKKSKPEPGNGNLNTMYFVNQARGNTQISRIEFVYDERVAISNVYLYLSFLLRILFVKKYIYTLAFRLNNYKLM